MTSLPFPRLRRLLTSMLCLAALGQAHEASALGLMQAYEAALANDPAYRAAMYDNEAGQQFKELGLSHLLPTLSANYATSKNRADITTSKPDVLPENRSYTSLSASITLRQPVLHLEGVARYRQGIAQTSASDAQFSARSQDLIVRLASLYAAAKYAEDQLAQATAQRDAYAEQRRSNERLFQRGEGTRTEVLETQAKFDLSEAQVLEARDNVIARLKNVQQRIFSRHPASKSQSMASVVERRQTGFEGGAGRVGRARVVEAFVFADGALRVRRGSVDRDDGGPGGRVGILSGVNGARGEVHDVHNSVQCRAVSRETGRTGRR